MPSRNCIREYVGGGTYHVYNRGINKQDIFLDKRDFATFLFYLKLYLSDPEGIKDIDPQKKQTIVRKNFYCQIDLLCYCLLPNHFHLLVRQVGKKDISEFMRSLMINYSMYFNSRYKKIGPLFQSRFRAVLVRDDSYFLHLSRYIHMNPLGKDQILTRLNEYEYSSYSNYLGLKDTPWVFTKPILEYFDKNASHGLINSSSYKEFVENNDYDPAEIVGDLILE